MRSHLEQTKKRLTIIFSIIVFAIIFILEVTFFSVKYITEIKKEHWMFSNLIENIESEKLSLEDIMNFWDNFNPNIKKWAKDKNHRPTEHNTLKPKGFINYVFIDNNSEVISHNIKDDIDQSIITEIYNNDDFFVLQNTSWFLTKKFKTQNGIFIILKDISYSLSDYLEDIFWFLSTTLLASIGFYFIGRKFVDKALHPVEENIKDMKDFIHNAGHELKTPISVIDSNIQLIDDMKIYDAEMTQELRIETQRLNSIIEGLITLSNIDTFRETEHISLQEIIKEIIKEYKFKISDKKLTINIDIEKSIQVTAYKNYLYICLSNIIWNAIKYNSKKGTIDISYKHGKLSIQDSGIGIEESDIIKVFDRFFKADNSRSSEGFGIGLSLVKKISDIYNWNIQVSSKEKKGSCFTIKF